MPGVDGIDVVASLHTLLPHMRIVAMCAFPEPEQIARAQQAGAGELIEKPIERDPLLRELPKWAREKAIGALKDADEKAASGAFYTPKHLAEMVVDAVASVDVVRMVNSGTEATMSDIRLARGFTGRDKIVKFEGCYHGHVDALLVKAGSGLVTLGNSSSAGVPENTVEDTIVIPLDDRNATLFADLAHAVVNAVEARETS